MAKILLVDDEPGILRAMHHTLKAAGHEVVGVANGRLAIEQLERDPPDLLITDIFMPEVEGMETIRKARVLRPDMPIVAISGVATEGFDYLQIAERLGAAATLKKPFRPAELHALVSRLLAGQNDRT